MPLMPPPTAGAVERQLWRRRQGGSRWLALWCLLGCHGCQGSESARLTPTQRAGSLDPSAD